MAAGSLSDATFTQHEDPQHAVLYSHFSSAERQHMIEEDLFSGRSVSLVLVSIVTIGLLGMIFSVLATL